LVCSFLFPPLRPHVLKESHAVLQEYIWVFNLNQPIPEIKYIIPLTLFNQISHHCSEKIPNIFFNVSETRIIIGVQSLSESIINMSLHIKKNGFNIHWFSNILNHSPILSQFNPMPTFKTLIFLFGVIYQLFFHSYPLLQKQEKSQFSLLALLYTPPVNKIDHPDYS